MSIIPTLLTILSIIHINLFNDNNKIKTKSLSWIILIWIYFIIETITFNNNLTNNNNLKFFITKQKSTNWSLITVNNDCLSITMIGLSTILTILCIIIIWDKKTKMIKEFITIHHIILAILTLAFIVNDLLAFYFLFESTLIPLFLMIGIWGYRKEKIKAAYYFFFYTFIGSLFMLTAIFKIYSLYGSTNIDNLKLIFIDRKTQTLLFIGLTTTLAVKIPMFPVHIWLPQAHVEAPINGSILLAGILLKLGGYGFIKFTLPTCKQILWYFSPILISLSLLAIAITALSTCRQNDIKKLIAYSSISHMGLMTIGIFSETIEGIIASTLLMVSHGLVSSSLFILSYFLYVRFKTRTIKYFKGLIKTLPILSSLFLVVTLSNIGFPGTLNFTAEILTLLSLYSINTKLLIIACSGPLLTTIYSLNIFNKINFGTTSKFIINPRDLNKKEFVILTITIIPIVWIGIQPSILINILKINLIFILS